MKLRDGSGREWKPAGIGRRDVLKAMLAAGAALPFAGISGALGAEAGEMELDRYGGWRGRTFEATGFFRTEHDGTRWWLVTPEGNAFISFGINHYHPNYWTVDQIRDHWVEKWGAEEAWDDAWKEGFRDEIIRDCAHFGLNTLGYHCETDIVMDDPLGRFMPNVRQYHPIPFSSYTNPGPGVYADVFEPGFAEHCDRLAQRLIKPFADDPMVLGIAMSDVPTMTDFESSVPWSGGPTWPKVLRNKGADAPGKQAYVAMMKERHIGIDAFNAAYETAFDSWDALAAATDWRADTDMENETELADNMAFMRACVDQYYKVAHEAIRRYDKNHLFLGEKWQANGDSYHNVIDVITPYVDVAFFQCYGEYSYMKPRLDEWSRLSGLPLLNGDSSFGAPREHVPRPGGTVMATEADRVAATLEYAEMAFARPDFVGWHMCGILEMWDTMPGQQRTQKIGLKSPTGEWRPEISEAVRSISARLYSIAAAE